MILREPIELAYLREQDQTAAQGDARADVDQAEMALGIAAHTVTDILNRYGVTFVERVIQQWRQPQPPTCEQCMEWSDRRQICTLRGAAELEQLPRSHAVTCHLFSDIGF